MEKTLQPARPPSNFLFFFLLAPRRTYTFSNFTFPGPAQIRRTFFSASAPRALSTFSLPFVRVHPFVRRRPGRPDGNKPVPAAGIQDGQARGRSEKSVLWRESKGFQCFFFQGDTVVSSVKIGVSRFSWAISGGKFGFGVF